jgi:hypothetical protein
VLLPLTLDRVSIEEHGNRDRTESGKHTLSITNSARIEKASLVSSGQNCQDVLPNFDEKDVFAVDFQRVFLGDGDLFLLSIFIFLGDYNLLLITAAWAWNRREFVGSSEEARILEAICGGWIGTETGEAAMPEGGLHGVGQTLLRGASVNGARHG